MTLSGYLALAEGVAYEALGADAVVLHLGSGTYYRLNEVATRIFESIAVSGEFSQVRSSMLQDFEIGGKALDADIAVLIDELIDLGLVVRVE